MKALLTIAATAMLLVTAPSFADKFEAVHAVEFKDSDRARIAVDALMQDPAMKGAKVSLYALDFGDAEASHVIVQDFDSYAEYMDSTAKRVASPGWLRYVHDTDLFSLYKGSQLVMVVDDHGAPRRSAGYLAVYLVHTSDPATYRQGVADLNKGVGNPGVFRLASMRTGTMTFNHVVLIGGPDFQAVNTYLDKLFASETFANFTAKVGATRKVVGVSFYRRVASWGG